MKGVSLDGLYVDSSDPEDPGQFAKNECNLNLQRLPAEGILRGLMTRLRYSHLEQGDPAGSGMDDLRFMVHYNRPRSEGAVCATATAGWNQRDPAHVPVLSKRLSASHKKGRNP